MSIAEQIRRSRDSEGMLKRSLGTIIQLYTRKAHFIYELLQNAEDAKASEILFVAKDDRLEVYHDGDPFTKENLNALCNIGQSDKVSDLNKIGEFGVGFKSVFGICEVVELYSQPRLESDKSTESISVCIQDFVTPWDIQQKTIDAPYTTKFEFPYAIGKDFTSFDTIEALQQSISKGLVS